MKRLVRHRTLLCLAACLGFANGAGAAEPLSFSRDVLPILSDRCFHCHGPDPKHREADLRLDVREAAIEHGALVPGKSSASELVRRIVSSDPDELMPPPASNRSLSPAEREVLKRWVDEGAPWGKHWAFEPPVRPPVPQVAMSHWPRNPIDVFILARLEREKLRPSPEASKETLLRRVYLDLVGLPPTPEEVDAFLLDNAPDAYERVADRLLASPRYGERWAWEWLDAARYADSNGYQGDPERTMWPWRDWVVSAVNTNMPYDRFTIEQLAGDLMPDDALGPKIATGFNRNHMFNGEGGRIAEETRVENVMDRAETVGTVWLGLTIGCARCHDHKYDPFTNRDYYSFYAYFNNTSETGGASGGGRSGQITPVLDFTTEAERQRIAALRAEVVKAGESVAQEELTVFPRKPGEKTADSPAAKQLSEKIVANLNKPPHEREKDARIELADKFKTSQPKYGKLLAELNGAISRSESAQNAVPRVMVMDDMPKPRETFMLDKGAYDKPLGKVEPLLPASLPALPKGASNNRLGLAQWLVDPEHPLTARVTVNRYWQSIFGVGLVKTAEDFGVQGERPSHPELLDWLACEFRDSKWDVKRLLRLIVTSSAYRQSSKVSPSLWERDPDNRLLARGPRFRLPSWLIRDQALAAGGLLVEKLGGPPVKPYQPEGIWEEATFGKKSYVQDHGEALYRRSLYIFWRRIVGPTMFFDTAARQTCTVKQVRTNTPLHALTTLNDVTFVEAARALAQRSLQSSAGGDESRIERAFRLATSRRPTVAEMQVLAASLGKLRAKYSADRSAAEQLLKVGESPSDDKLDTTEHAALTALALMILNLDETLTKQ